MNWNWHRPKDVLPERALAAEARLGAIKKAAKKFKSSVEESLKTAPGKNRGEDASVRKRRTAEHVLGDNVAAAVHYLNEEKVAMCFSAPVVSPLNTVLERFANLEKTIGHMVAVNEGELQAFVSSDTPLSRLLAEDVPAVAAAKKDLEQLCRKHSQCQATLDKEQKKLDKMYADEEGADPEAVALQREKRDRIAHELEILNKDVQLDQDRLASTLLTLTSRENRYARSVYEIMRIKKQFYENAYKTIEAELPNIQRLLEDTNIRPVFGEQLEDHLKATGRRIAYPIALSIAYLLESGLEDEGLFRISAKQIKIDKFKAALDSRGSITELLADGDPHLHASLLKCYLRELPEPLLGGGATYDRWVRAARLISLQERLAAFREILRTERSGVARENIQYVVKFLHELSCKCEETKMTPRNISIVMGPTLLWSNRVSSTQPGSSASSSTAAAAAAAVAASEQLMEQGNLENVIGAVATLIEHYDEVFDNDIDLELEDDAEVEEVRLEALRLAEVLDSASSPQSCFPPDRPPPPAAAASTVMSSSLTVPSSSRSLLPESPSPGQRRKPSMRGMGGRLMNNPVGRNIMSKIGHSSSSSSSSSYHPQQQQQHHYSSAPSTPNFANSGQQAVSMPTIRRSLQDEGGGGGEEVEVVELEEEDEEDSGDGVERL